VKVLWHDCVVITVTLLLDFANFLITMQHSAEHDIADNYVSVLW